MGEWVEGKWVEGKLVGESIKGEWIKGGVGDASFVRVTNIKRWRERMLWERSPPSSSLFGIHRLSHLRYSVGTLPHMSPLYIILSEILSSCYSAVESLAVFI